MSENRGDTPERRGRQTEPAKDDIGETGEQRITQAEPTKPTTPTPSDEDVVWVRIAPSQVVRTIVIALLSAAVVLGALFLLWQVRSLIGWAILALFLAAVLNPAVNWLERRRIKRSIGILLTYLGVVLGQLGLGSLFNTLSERLSELPSQLGQLARSFLLSAGGLAVSAATFVSALVSILTLTFFLLLIPEGFMNGGLRVFAGPQRPRLRRLLGQSAGAVSGYITGNLAISFICGVLTFIVLLVLGMPYPAALALLVALLDLIPLVGATLGGALLVIVGFFVSPLTAIILLVYVLVYEQVEGSVLQPLVYSRAVQLNALVIFIAVLVGAALLGIPGA